MKSKKIILKVAHAFSLKYTYEFIFLGIEYIEIGQVDLAG